MSEPSSPDPTKRPDGRGRHVRVRKVNPKQRLFILEYLKKFNALDAARKAGFSKKDLKAGDRLLNIPHVAAEINRVLLRAQTRLEVEGDDIRQGFARIAFDPREVKAGGPTRLERMMALSHLAKIYGLYINKHIFTGATLEQLLSEGDAIEAQLGPPTPPLRLLPGGKS